MLPLNPDDRLAHELNTCHSKSRRNGKVARLPALLRHQVNQMLDNGLPYKTIIQKLGPAGAHLNDDNISNWRLGGYRDYLNAEAINTRAQVQTEAAADIIRQQRGVDPAELRRVCSQMFLLQYIETLAVDGEHFARQILEKNPAKYITLVNACTNLSHANIALEKHQWRLDDAARKAKPQATPHPGTQPKITDTTPENEEN